MGRFHARLPGAHAWLAAVAVVVPLSLGLAVYWPGLSGAFLFDDFSNLAVLGEVSLTEWREASLAQFLGSARAGPTGRPLAMLSFLPHEAYWPFDARPFLRTNLLLHVAIGLVALGLVRRLALLGGDFSERRATVFAAIVATVWLLHPLQASTVLYTVQRMAQLSMLFVLLSVYAYVIGRTKLREGHQVAGWFMIALAPLLAVVGAYAKENAGLVPVALLLTEYWFFNDRAGRDRWVRTLRLVMLWLPSALILAYLVSRVGASGYESRDFTAIERLLTQARILVDYLGLLLLPSQATAGLFHDAYPVSRGLLQPISTLLALLACAALVVLSFRYRRRYPLLTWGVLFFFAMHLAESSTLPLELYFEHRNYLPSLGIMLAATTLCFALYGYRRYLGVFAVVAMLATVGALAHLRAQNWGHPLRQAEIWARLQPDSPRVWQNLALRHDRAGYPSGVRYAYRRWQQLEPDAIVPVLSLLVYECPASAVSDERWARLRGRARSGRYQHGLLVTLNRLTVQTQRQQCHGLRPQQVHVLIRSLLDNPDVRNRYARQRLWHLDGQLLLASGFSESAIAAFRRSHRYLDDPFMRMIQARYLAQFGHYESALELLAAADHGAKESIYGPLHVYWLIDDPGRLEELAREIRARWPDAPADETTAATPGMPTTDPRPAARIDAPDGTPRG